MGSFFKKYQKTFLENSRFRISIEICLFVAILIFAYQFTFYAGERGFFAFDQSIVFDGSYRVFSGQIPFEDFVIPFGPVTFWLQGAIFKLIGISYASYIFGAALVNVLVAGLSYYLLRILFPQQRIVAFLGSIITAIWFYPPFGTPWPEQTAFFFSLTALTVIITGLFYNQISLNKKKVLYFVSGLIAFAAFMSKQNAGAFILPVCALLFLAPNQKSFNKRILDLIVFSLGWLTGMAAFGLWLFIKSNTSLFLKFFIEIPASEVGIERLPGNLGAWIVSVFVGSGSNTIIAISILSSLIAIIVLFENKSAGSYKAIHQRRFIAALLTPSLFFYHNIYLITSNNQSENAIPFIGMIAAIGLGLLLPWGENQSPKSAKSFLQKIPTMKIIAGGILLVLMVFTSWYGINVAISRQVHGIFSKSTFPNHLSTGKLSAIKWGEPTRIGNLIPADDFDQLVNYLEDQGENFFVFPDFTILYGALGVPSPQPMLWFHGGLTYSKTYDPALDAWIVTELEENLVRIIILEEESWFHTDERIADFPQLGSFITENFDFETRFGNFMIYSAQE